MRKNLSILLEFSLGLNPSRYDIETGNNMIYTKENFEDDLDFKSFFNYNSIRSNSSNLNIGDVLIDTSTNKAAIVGKQNAGKIASSNFVLVHFISQELDKTYFVYIFNESNYIKKQKTSKLQGTGYIQKLSIKDLAEIKIPIIDINKQKKIGEIYRESRLLLSKKKSSIKNFEIATKIILENIVGEENERGLYKIK